MDDDQKVRIGKPVPLDWVGRNWYLATVRGGQDYAAREWLEDQGVAVFMLEGTESVRPGGKGKRSMVSFPVFAGYLFVEATHHTIDVMRGLASEVKARANVDRLYAGSEQVANVRTRRTIAVSRATRCLSNPITGWIGVDGVPNRVSGGNMQVLFTMHESALHVHKSEREANRARVRIGDLAAISDGPFKYIEGLVKSFTGSNHVEILAELFGRKTLVKVPLDSLEQIEV